MVEPRDGGAASRLRSLALRFAPACAVLLLGYGVGCELHRDREGERVEAAVRTAVDDAARDDLEGIWNRLSVSTVAHFKSSHAGMLTFARWLKENRATIESARLMADAAEKEHGATLDEMLASDPRGFWARETRRSMGGSGLQEGATSLVFESVESDGLRARASCRLPGGGIQGFDLVLEDGEWRLVDFTPVRPAGAGPSGRAPAPPAPALTSVSTR